MKSIGTLTPNTNLIHMVWVTESDIKLVADSGASVVHNPVSNLKLGSGIAPVEKYLRAGINVSLGTDNNNANDNANMLETVKFGTLVNTMRTFNYDDWLGAESMVRCATYGGARCAGRENEVGELSSGKKADFIVFRLDTSTFCPPNNLIRQLVDAGLANNRQRTDIDRFAGDVTGIRVNQCCLYSIIAGRHERVNSHDHIAKRQFADTPF